MSHCNFKYFKYCEGLVKSIRYAGNEHRIILKLLDFTQEQQKHAALRLKNVKDIDLDFIDSRQQIFWDKNCAEAQFYQNCRPFLINDILEKYDDDLLCICANGLVFTDLAEIQTELKNVDFIFKERKTWFGLKTIEDVAWLSRGENLKRRLDAAREEALKSGINVDPRSEGIQLENYLESNGEKLSEAQLFHLPMTRVCLLGTLGISNNTLTKKLIKTWSEYILKEEQQEFFTSFVNSDAPVGASIDSDTLENDSFIRSYVNIGLSGIFGRRLTKNTNLWDGGVVDATCTSDKIWFGKGSIKTGGGKTGQGKRYLEKLKFFHMIE